jgi:hypothetical protein
MPDWTTLGELQPGALFRTRAGILAVKSEYYYPNAQSECVLLASGEYAHFPEKNDVEVQEIPLALVKAVPDLLTACEALIAEDAEHKAFHERPEVPSVKELEEFYSRDWAARRMIYEAVAKARGEEQTSD